MALRELFAWLQLVRPGNAEEGQGGLEYALVAGVVVVAIVTAFTAFPVGDIVTTSLQNVANLVK